MTDYQFLTYEPRDDEARNAQNRGMLVELNEAFLVARQMTSNESARAIVADRPWPASTDHRRPAWSN